MPDQDPNRQKGEDGEQYVHQIATRAYLSYWCFPNPCDEDGDRKEVVDLLIWLDDVLILIAIKNYQFKGDYERYHRKTIEKAARQIQGAERKLLGLGRDIIVQHPTRGRVTILRSSIKRVVRLIINLGDGEEYYEAARTTSQDQFISILDRDAMETCLDELDTIKDLVAYFTDRAELLCKLDRIVIAGKEKDLLAKYITNAREMPDVPPETAMVVFDIDGAWEMFVANEQKAQRDEANRRSYFVDELVKRELSLLPGGWIAAEPLMLLSRVERRIFANAFFNLYDSYTAGQPETKTNVLHAKRYIPIGGVGFTFLLYQKRYDDTALIPTLLSTAMYGHVLVDELKLDSVWALATDEEMSRFYFAHGSTDALSDEAITDFQFNLKLLGWNTNLEYKRWKDNEFPEEKSSG